MRTKTFCVFDFLDKLFWRLIALVPLILYAISLHHASTTIAFSDFLHNSLGVVVSSDSILYSSFTELFVAGNGIFDLFVSGGILIDMLVWLFAVEFAHILFDALVFIPRWCGNIMDKAVAK